MASIVPQYPSELDLADQRRSNFNSSSETDTDKSSANGNGSANGHTNGATAPVDKLAYTDDDADVRLKSTDGRVFKVHSYLLKAHSAYFRTLLAQGTDTSNPIPISANTKLLKLVLDLMHLKPAPSGAIWAYRTPLLRLCDELQLKGVAERILFSMHENVDKDPWAIFTLASQRHSLALARSALRAMHDHHVHAHAHAHADGAAAAGVRVQVDKLSPELVKDVALPYLLGVFAAALKAAEGAEKGHQVGWKEVADKFVPITA